VDEQIDVTKTNGGGCHPVSQHNRAVRCCDHDAKWKGVEYRGIVDLFVDIACVAVGRCAAVGTRRSTHDNQQDRTGEQPTKNECDERRDVGYPASFVGKGIPSVSSFPVRALCRAAPFNSGRHPLTA
ncbi:MAG: hypothetical protein RJB08_1702, partial [Actinomycetota bacterium]